MFQALALRQSDWSRPHLWLTTMQHLQFHDQTQSCTNTMHCHNYITTASGYQYFHKITMVKPLIAKGYLEGLKLGLTWQNRSRVSIIMSRITSSVQKTTLITRGLILN